MVVPIARKHLVVANGESEGVELAVAGTATILSVHGRAGAGRVENGKTGPVAGGDVKIARRVGFNAVRRPLRGELPNQGAIGLEHLNATVPIPFQNRDFVVRRAADGDGALELPVR